MLLQKPPFSAIREHSHTFDLPFAINNLLNLIIMLIPSFVNQAKIFRMELFHKIIHLVLKLHWINFNKQTQSWIKYTKYKL